LKLRQAGFNVWPGFEVEGISKPLEQDELLWNIFILELRSILELIDSPIP
jgi:hypothetical protein